MEGAREVERLEKARRQEDQQLFQRRTRETLTDSSQTGLDCERLKEGQSEGDVRVEAQRIPAGAQGLDYDASGGPTPISKDRVDLEADLLRQMAEEGEARFADALERSSLPREAEPGKRCVALDRDLAYAGEVDEEFRAPGGILEDRWP